MNEHNASSRLRGFLQGLRIDRAVRFVWQAAPGWTLLSLALIAVQSAVPLATLYVFKLLVDRLTAFDAQGAASSVFDGYLILIGMALIVTVVGVLCGRCCGMPIPLRACWWPTTCSASSRPSPSTWTSPTTRTPSSSTSCTAPSGRRPAARCVSSAALTQVARDSLTLVGALALLLTFHWVRRCRGFRGLGSRGLLPTAARPGSLRPAEENHVPGSQPPLPEPVADDRRQRQGGSGFSDSARA